MVADERDTGAVFGERLGVVDGVIGRLLAVERPCEFIDLPAIEERTDDDGADIYGV